MKMILLFGLLFQGDDQMLDEQIRQLEQRLKRDEMRVTIEKKGAKIEDVLDEFRRQAQISIIARLERVPPDYVVPDFEVRGVPFKEAFNHFLRLTNLMIVDESPNVIVIERPHILEAVNFKESDIRVVIDTLAKISGVNITVSPKVSGTVSLTMENVPWFAVLQSVVSINGLATMKDKYGIISVVTQEELYKQVETRWFQLKYLQPPSPYRPQKKDDPYIKAANTEVAGGYDDVIKQFAFLRLVEAMLTKDASGSMIGSYKYDPMTNTLVVTDIKPALDNIEQLIKKLDVEPLQVSLDVTFVTTKNEDLLTFGIDYFGGAGASSGLELTTRVRPDTGQITPSIISKFPFGVTNRDLTIHPYYFTTDLENKAILRAFKKDTYTKLEQRPNIQVTDGEETTIFVGEQVPYAVANIIVQPGSTPQATLIEGSKSPVQVGFQLLVLPRVLREEGKVHLTIIPKNVILTGSDTTQPGFQRFTLAAFGSNLELLLPRLGETALMTKLIIEDGQTSIIGGLVVNRVSLEDRGLPFLKDIPLIGYAFKLRTDSKTNEYLLIFVTPRIIRNSEDVQKALNAKIQKRQLQLLSELKRIKEDK